MKRQLRFPPLALLLMLLISSGARGATRARGIHDWDNLGRLTPGTEIKVLLTNGKSCRGKFQSSSHESIVVKSGHGQQTFNRINVLRVSAKGESNRLRNALIGSAIGAGAGLAFGAAADGGDFSSHFANRNSGKEIFVPSFAVLGAIVGAALPARGWRDTYRSRSTHHAGAGLALLVLRHIREPRLLNEADSRSH